jgi:DNA-binding GntR family transcriptional regulator
MSIIRRQPLYTEISRYIQEEIFSNRLKPGDRIVETKIAKELGVSQAPVRESIRMLELIGVVETKPFLGTFVKTLRKKDIEDAYEVRKYLEMLAVKEAAKFIDDEKLNEIEKIFEEMKKAAQRQDFQRFVEIDICFHQKIIDISGNKLLNKVWNLVNLSKWTYVTTNISTRSLVELADRHKDIIESLKKRDIEEAVSNMSRHIQELKEEILAKFTECEE